MSTPKLLPLRDIYDRRTTPDGYGDKGTAHSYIEIYEQLLEPMRMTARAVLEIGVGPRALSLRMWDAYFPNALIVGIDPDPLLEPVPEGVHVICADAYTAETARRVAALSGGYDLIVDDGSHALGDQLAAIRLYRPLLAPGGLLVIEDVDHLDHVRSAFTDAGSCEIFDLRPVKNRYDDVLVVFRHRPI
jgi:hypothetical protein